MDVQSSTGGGPVAVGFMALLIGAFGPVAADVMLVVISALAGCFIALSGVRKANILEAVGFVILGVTVSLVLAWALAGLVTSYVPSLAGPYLPSVIAMFIGFLSNRLPTIFNAIVNKAEEKVGINETKEK